MAKNTSKTLSIISLVALGLCLILGVVKAVDKKKSKGCDKACAILFFVAVVLIAVSSLLDQVDGFKPSEQWVIGVGNLPMTFPKEAAGSGKESFGARKKKCHTTYCNNCPDGRCTNPAGESCRTSSDCQTFQGKGKCIDCSSQWDCLDPTVDPAVGCGN